MPNPYFRFKQFTVFHDRCAMKVTTDSCFFGAWAAEIIQNSKVKRQNLLDIGAGSGLLSLMVAQKNDLLIDAVEIDPAAAGQAKENIEASPWKERIRVHNENILSFRPGEPFDTIICNPPFYENELTSNHKGKNIAHHSEELLFSQLLPVIAKNLSANGLFFLLYPFKRREEISTLLHKNHLYALQSVVLQQSVNHVPFRMMTMGTNKISTPAPDQEIAVWDEKQQYTKPFIDLLKDYYLYL